jgi:hypothetical protein
VLQGSVQIQSIKAIAGESTVEVAAYLDGGSRWPWVDEPVFFWAPRGHWSAEREEDAGAVELKLAPDRVRAARMPAAAE